MPNEAERDFAKEYSEEGFWTKAKLFAKKAGRGVLELALKLYFSAQDPSTPPWAKAAIFGALGYFIAPIDAVPDALPGIGFADDLGVLSAAFATVAVYVKDEHVIRAKETLARWFDAPRDP